MPTQVFFCGGDKDEFDKFKRGLHSLAVASTKKATERTLKIELNDEPLSVCMATCRTPCLPPRGASWRCGW